MIPSPTLKVLSTMQKHRVKALLMRGQACVWFGGAEFSRDTDLVVLVESQNILRLRIALEELQAYCIAVPPFDPQYLERGHAIHFRCRVPEAAGLRVDIMAKLRGVDPFPELWTRRETLHHEDGSSYELLSLPDLVQAKKTQRDKDWPMLRRLLEAHYVRNREKPSAAQIRFWFGEMRTPELLVHLAHRFSDECRQCAQIRPLLHSALKGALDKLTLDLQDEMAAEAAADREYWAPLKKELQELRRMRRS